MRARAKRHAIWSRSRRPGIVFPQHEEEPPPCVTWWPAGKRHLDRYFGSRGTVETLIRCQRADGADVMGEMAGGGG